MVDKYFNGTVVLAAVGNHEGVPSDRCNFSCFRHHPHSYAPQFPVA
jgi:hypothetical protein